MAKGYSFTVTRENQSDPLAVMQQALMQAQAESAVISVRLGTLDHPPRPSEELKFTFRPGPQRRSHDLVVSSTTKEALNDVLAHLYQHYGWGHDIQVEIEI